MIASSQALLKLYGAIYPADGSHPTHPAAVRYREDPVALTQLLLSLMIQLAQAQEQGIKDAATIARAVAEVAQGSAGDAGGGAVPQGGAASGGGGVDYDNPMPAVSATTTPFVPAVSPMAGPMTPAAANGGGAAPFQPANASAPAAS